MPDLISMLFERSTFWVQTVFMVVFVCWAVQKPKYQLARVVGGHTPFWDYTSVALAAGGAATSLVFNLGLEFAPDWVAANFGVMGVLGLRAFDIGLILYVVLPAWRKRWTDDSRSAADGTRRTLRTIGSRGKASE